MILLSLFLHFFKIGAVSFGGGYGMISLIRDTCLANGWLTEAQLLDLIAVAESTPGPIAVNVATFVGASQAGIPGALLATLGVVLPSCLVILLIAALMGNLVKYAGVKAILSGIRPGVIGLILGTGAILLAGTVLGTQSLSEPIRFDPKGLLILGVLAIVSIGVETWRKKKISPFFLILLSGLMGVLLYR